MNRNPRFIDDWYFGFVIILLLFLFLSCDTVKTVSCFDCATVPIPEKDNTPPTFFWQVKNLRTNQTQTFTGIEDSLIVKAGTEHEITLIAKDMDGGIKRIEFTGISNGITCMDLQTNQGTGKSSIARELPLDFSNLNPALKEWRITRTLGTGVCGEGMETYSTREIYVEIENYHGGIIAPSFILIGKSNP